MPPTEPAPLTREDVDALAMSLPEVVREGTEDRPSYAVNGKGFLFWREPRKDAVDPDTGERMDDVIVVLVPSAEDKEAVLQTGPPWFTTPHFNGHQSVLVRERDLGALEYVELAEVVTDAWATKAPKKLVKEHLG